MKFIDQNVLRRVSREFVALLLLDGRSGVEEDKRDKKSWRISNDDSNAATKCSGLAIKVQQTIINVKRKR